ncbi:conjugative transposon protein TraM [Echinicola sp. 20G]|uniref:conjugative transposon protein TraM n=1 Tax=Echinicola sp. 20G TaxID=2781961 RepID=UPI001910DA3B|nr:conjugative transposon protein TraM [Echinicola sp. 20G]
MNNQNELFRRKRRMMVFLPLLTVPFLFLAFWALGGGNPQTISEKGLSSGINLSLPNAEINDSRSLTKLDLYEKEEKRARKKAEQSKLDPFMVLEKQELIEQEPFQELKSTEAEIGNQLDAIQKLINTPSINDVKKKETAPVELKNTGMKEDIEQLGSLMEQMNRPLDEDPEMERISQMLDKLLDVQHPERVKQRLEESRMAQKHFSVERKGEVKSPSKNEIRTNGFYGLESPKEMKMEPVAPAIAALVYGNQRVVTGETVELELSEGIVINGIDFQKGSLVYGVCSLKGERLGIEVTAIRKDKMILPVDLVAHDMDAMEGIRIPGSITHKTFQEEGRQTMQSGQIAGFDNTWQMQAASAGTETVKGLLSKKMKKVQVSLKSGHPLLLVDHI